MSENGKTVDEKCLNCPQSKVKLSTLVRVLNRDQRPALVAKARQVAKQSCPVCNAKQSYQFGFVYYANSRAVVSGISVQCSECADAFAWVFEPVDSLTMVRIAIPRKDKPEFFEAKPTAVKVNVEKKD